MKSFSAGSLIQVHYHDRPGGVAKVMAAYTHAFNQCHKQTPGANIVVCKHQGGIENGFALSTTINVPQCDYHHYEEKSKFYKTRDALKTKLLTVFRSTADKLPLLVIGHNMTLGKNCALSSAFAQCARECEQISDEIRFFSVIHDFAEEGRADCIRQINRLSDWGVAIGDDLYPTTKNLRFVALNKRNYTLLKNAGFCVDLLPNCLGSFDAVEQKTRIISGATNLGKKWSHPDRPVFLYPSRILSRKNIVEAVLIASFVYKANLIVGNPGASNAHKKLFTSIKNLCLHYQLPVQFHYGGTDDVGISRAVFDRADACISTSIAEGFGYALYEPWFLSKPVIGRKPLGFSPSFGLQMPYVYERIPVPVSWLSMDILVKKYFDRLQQWYAPTWGRKKLSFKKFNQEFTSVFIKNDTIDFGCLSLDMQIDIVKRLLESTEMVGEWEAACSGELKKIRSMFTNGLKKNNPIVEWNRNRILEQNSGAEILKKFKVCYLNPKQICNPENRHEEIGRFFRQVSGFRLLLTPE